MQIGSPNLPLRGTSPSDMLPASALPGTTRSTPAHPGSSTHLSHLTSPGSRAFAAPLNANMPSSPKEADTTPSMHWRQTVSLRLSYHMDFLNIDMPQNCIKRMRMFLRLLHSLLIHRIKNHRPTNCYQQLRKKVTPRFPSSLFTLSCVCLVVVANV